MAKSDDSSGKRDGRRREGDGNGSGPSPGNVTVVDPKKLKRTVAATGLGNAMEWYDFGVFSYLAVTLGQVFFPEADPSTQVISTFALFAGAFVARPIGGLVFGALGDRLGRQRTLATTMIMMASATTAIGLIPSYATIGYAASFLLLLLRLVQGFSTGGEYGGATTFVTESSPDRRRGMLASWLEFGTLSGFVLGAVVVTSLTVALPPETMTSWGWRIPFLIGGPLGLIGLYMRLKLEESPAFQQHQEQSGGGEDGDAQSSERSTGDWLREIFTKHRRAMAICAGLVIAFNVTDYMLLSYMPTYLTSNLKVPETEALLLISGVMVVMMGLNIGLGRLSDRVGRRPVMIAGCAGFVVLSYPAFLLIGQATRPWILAGLLLLGLLLLCFTSTMPSTLPALFPTGIRYGALSISFNLSVSLFGGTTPLIVAGLIQATGSNTAPAFYLIAAALIGLLAVVAMRETARRPLPGSTPTVDSKEEAREVAGQA